MRISLIMLIVLSVLMVALPLPAASDSESARFPTWEYKVLSVRDLSGAEVTSQPQPLPMIKNDLGTSAKQAREALALTRLNALGAEGWELIQVQKDHYYFKRRR